MTAHSPVRTEIAGVPVMDLARQFGTPCFVYDAAKILERLGDLESFDTVRFAQKACSNLAIVDLVRRHGGLVDAVSANEVRRALAAGYQPQGSPPPVVYTADIFDAESLELVVEKNIHVNCGSPDMIDQYGSRAPAARSPSASIPVLATATVRRPTRGATPPNTASGTSSSTTASSTPTTTG